MKNFYLVVVTLRWFYKSELGNIRPKLQLKTFKIFVVLQSPRWRAILFNLHCQNIFFFQRLMNEKIEYSRPSKYFCKSNFWKQNSAMNLFPTKLTSHFISSVSSSHVWVSITIKWKYVSPEDLAWLLQHLLSYWKSQNPPAGKKNHSWKTWICIIGLWQVLTDDVLPFLLVTLSKDPS